MKYGYTPKWGHPKKMITHFSETFKDVDVKKTNLRNLLLVLLAVAAAKTFRINAIVAGLPIRVKKEKSKQKRLLRFLETPLPLNRLMKAWCLFVCHWVWKSRTQHYFYLLIDEAFKEPMFLISNVYEDAEIHDAYKRRTQIEQGFRDIKTRFGFRHIVLKKPTKARIRLLGFIVSLTYGLTFLCYEKTIQPVAKHRNTQRKLYAVITLIRDILMETWTSEALLTSLEDCRCRGDTSLVTY